MAKILLNADVEYALRMWTGTDFVEKLSTRGHSCFIFTPFGRDVHNLDRALALPNVLKGSFKDDYARPFHSRDVKDIPVEFHAAVRGHIHSMLNSCDLTIVASAGERFINQEIIRLSKEMKKPVVFMVEGLNNADYGIPVYPEAVFVWGDVMRQVFLDKVKNSKPCPAAVLRVTGSPRFDIHFKRAAQAQNVLRQILVAMPCYHPSYNEEEARGVLAGITKLELTDYSVLIHPHPGSSDELWRRLATEVGLKSFTIDRQKPIADCLAESSVVVTGASTIALEAMIFDKPVVCLSAFGHLAGQRHFLPLYSSNARYLVTNYVEAANALKRAISFPGEQSENRREIVKRYFANGGDASDACVDEIERMLKLK